MNIAPVALVSQHCQAALKEWASVTVALRDGRQLILLRKGGLADKGRRFTVQEREFFLYPTYVHQQAHYVRPGALVDLGQGDERPAIVFDTFATVYAAVEVRDLSALQRLGGEHIWTDDFLGMRFAYKPENPLWALVLRVHRLTSPLQVPQTPRYRGCRSWVKLAEPLPLGTLTPALSDSVFAGRAAGIAAVLSEGRGP